MIRYSILISARGYMAEEGFLTVEAAADYIVRNDSPYGWTIVAQEANKITATTPQRDLRPTEWARAAERGFRRPYDPERSQVREAPDEDRRV
jgi:hypothetical protein